jgi:hypothetical protein
MRRPNTKRTKHVDLLKALNPLKWSSLQHIGFTTFGFGLLSLGVAWIEKQTPEPAVIQDLSVFMLSAFATAYSELLSISFTILVLDRISKNFASNEERTRITELFGAKNTPNELNKRLALDLRVYGWHKNIWEYRSSRDMKDAKLEGVNLSDFNLARADLTNANLRKADLRGTDLRGAYLRNAKLRFITADKTTKFPSIDGGYFYQTESPDPQIQDLAVWHGWTTHDWEEYHRKHNLT